MGPVLGARRPLTYGNRTEKSKKHLSDPIKHVAIHNFWQNVAHFFVLKIILSL